MVCNQLIVWMCRPTFLFMREVFLSNPERSVDASCIAALGGQHSCSGRQSVVGVMLGVYEMYM